MNSETLLPQGKEVDASHGGEGFLPIADVAVYPFHLGPDGSSLTVLTFSL